MAPERRAAPGALPGTARLALAWAWSGWEWLFGKLFRLYEVPGRRDAVIRFGFRRWREGPVRLLDGTVVEPGDWVAEVHIHSPRVLQRWVRARGETPRLVATLAAEMRAILAAFAAELESGRLAVPVKALYGKTLLHRAAARLGFEVHDLPGGGSRLLSLYERWLLLLYHPGGRRRAASPERLRIVWMSRRALLSVAGPARAPGGEPRSGRPDGILREPAQSGALDREAGP